MSAADTERVFDGRSVLGPYIQPEAYAAYAEGSYLETQGNWVAAEQAYRRALRHDPDNASIWTRLGVLACRRDSERALEAFRSALATPGYAPAWAERARCLHQHGQTRPALESALRAVLLSPKDASANLLLVQIYREQGQVAQAQAWLLAWTLYSPEVASHWADVQREAALSGDGALAKSARAQLERRREHAEVNAPDASSPPVDAATPAVNSSHMDRTDSVRAALSAGDLAAAQTAATVSAVPALDVALIASSLGRPELALAQAQLILAAAPEDGDALIVALSAAALGNNERELAALLRLAVGAKPPRPELAKLVLDLLDWQVGDEAVEVWKQAYRAAQAAAPAPPPR
jgi:tetratricopeptide (TPR) repeat protein